MLKLVVDAGVPALVFSAMVVVGMELIAGHRSATSEEYLAHPDRGEVDCLVIDVRLPGMDGLELLEKVQA